MSRLDELKSSPDVGRPERVVTVCVSGKLVAELEGVGQELAEVRRELAEERRKAGSDDEEPQGPPKRAGEASPIPGLIAREKALKAQVEAIQERMGASSVALTLRAIQDGAWRQWVLKHSARREWVRTGGTEDAPEGDERIVERDRQWAAGVCNIDALVADLHLFIARYDGESASDEWWSFIQAEGAGGDMLSAASSVVVLQEQGVSHLGKAKRSPDSQGSATASE